MTKSQSILRFMARCSEIIKYPTQYPQSFALNKKCKCMPGGVMASPSKPTRFRANLPRAPPCKCHLQFSPNCFSGLSLSITVQCSESNARDMCVYSNYFPLHLIRQFVRPSRSVSGTYCSTADWASRKRSHADLCIWLSS